MLPVPRVAVEDRYAVVKTKTLEGGRNSYHLIVQIKLILVLIQGCYGVTYYIGFRERSNVKVNYVTMYSSFS